MVRFFGIAIAVAVAASIAPAAEPLKGTFVREMIVGQQMGNQIVLTFDDGHLTAKLTSGGRSDDGHEGWITLTFDGEYAITPGGLVCGVVTGLNADMSKIPDNDLATAPFGESAHKLIGEPFSFRARMSEKGLMVSDVKVPQFESLPATPKSATGREMVAAFAGGTYAKSATEKVPLPKLATSKRGEAAVLDVIEGLFGPILRTELKGNIRPSPVMSSTGPVYGQTLPPLPSGPMSVPPPMPGNVIYAQPVPITPVGNPPMPGNVIYAQPVPTTPVGNPAFPTLSQYSQPLSPVGEDAKPFPLMREPVSPVPPSPPTPPATPAKGLEGTFVRDVVVAEAGGGMRAMLTFKGDRLTAKFVEFVAGDDGKVKSGGYEFECTAHRTADGYIVGRVVGVEVDFKDAPLENGLTAETCKGLAKAYGEPFCFRCDVRDGTMTVADLHVPLPDGAAFDAKAVRDTAVAFVGGKYRKVESANVPLPKMAKKKAEPPMMELVPNGIRVVTPFTPHPGLPMTVRAEAGPLPSALTPPMAPMPNPPTILPTSGQMPPPGTMRATPVPTMVREAWERSTLPPLSNPPPIPPTK